MNNENFMELFVESFPNPEPKEELILKVQQQMATAMTRKQRLPHKALGVVVLITLATLPLFSVVNYFYYIALQQIIVTYFPQMLTSFLIVFTVSVTLIGAICYGFIPIWIAYSLHRRV
ncbi:hypothetical protein [Candidatus Uabimicrobium amorphum]|uniref:hypothetical protein n=1 Tax=Uabimicrobium amorphum TaxID=2596890 RepID=UPI0034A5C400